MGNTVTGHAGSGILTNMTGMVAIEENLVTDNSQRGSAVTEMSHAHVAHNTVERNVETGIQVIDYSVAVVCGNEVLDTLLAEPTASVRRGNGIIVDFFSEVVLAGNVVRNSPRHGVGVLYGSQSPKPKGPRPLLEPAPLLVSLSKVTPAAKQVVIDRAPTGESAMRRTFGPSNRPSERATAEFRVPRLEPRRTWTWAAWLPFATVAVVLLGGVLTALVMARTEPTETECMEALDEFCDALLAIAEEADKSPDLLTNAPQNTRLRRLDETTAARKPKLRWQPE